MTGYLSSSSVMLRLNDRETGAEKSRRFAFGAVASFFSGFRKVLLFHSLGRNHEKAMASGPEVAIRLGTLVGVVKFHDINKAATVDGAVILGTTA